MLTSLVLKMLHSNTGRKPVSISLQLFRSKIQSAARHPVVFTHFSVLLLCVSFPLFAPAEVSPRTKRLWRALPKHRGPTNCSEWAIAGRAKCNQTNKTFFYFFLMGRISKLGKDHPLHTHYVLSAQLLLCKVSSPKLRIKPSNRVCYKLPREGELVFNQGKLKGVSLLSRLKQRVTAHRHSLSIHPTKARKTI